MFAKYLLAMLSAVLLWAMPAMAAELVKARLGILSGAAQTGLVVAVKQGFFAQHGFDVSVHALTGGVQGSQALAADQVDWSGGGIEPTIVAASIGLPSTPYAMYAKGGDSYGVLVRREAGINSAADLNGKRVAMVPGTATVFGFEQFLKTAGLPNNAVQRVNSNYNTMGQLLIQGAVDAMVGIEPFLTLTSERMSGDGVMLARLGKFVQGGGFFMISDKWAAANPGKARDAVEALWQGEQFVRKHPAESARLYAEFIKTDPATIQSAYRYLTFNPLVDDFTVRSFDATAQYLLKEKRISKQVTSEGTLAEARRIGAELAASHPEMLQ